MLLRKVVTKVLGQDPDLVPLRIIGIIGIPAIIGLGELRESAFGAWDPLMLRLLIAGYLGVITVGSYLWEPLMIRRLFLIFYYLVTVWVSLLSATNDSYGYTANLIVVVATGMIVVIKDNRNLLIYAAISILIPSITRFWIQRNYVENIIFSINLFINVVVLYAVSLAKIKITDEARDRILKLNALKEGIINSIDEQIKRPLADVLESVDELSKVIADITPILLDMGRPNPNLYLGYMMHSVSDIMSIVDGTTVLNSMRSGNRKLELSPINLHDVINSIVGFHKSQDNGSHIIESRLDQISGKFDGELILQAIDRLIDNALVYSVSETTVSINLYRDSDKAIIEISDQGIGIPEIDQDRVFDEFHRGSNVGYRQGMGLGLTIVKESIALHRGTVHFQSIEGQTIFTVTLSVE